MFTKDRSEYLVSGIELGVPELVKYPEAGFRMRMMATEQYEVAGYYYQTEDTLDLYPLNGDLTSLHEANLVSVINDVDPDVNACGYFFVFKTDKPHHYNYSHHFIELH